MLRVCVSPDGMPWCFRNTRGEIVGFDVGLAHILAVELRTRLMLVPAWAFITRDDRRGDFASVERIRALTRPRVAVLRVQEWIDRLHAVAPDADVVTIGSINAARIVSTTRSKAGGRAPSASPAGASVVT